MKKILVVFIMLFSFFIGINKVNALEEYDGYFVVDGNEYNSYATALNAIKQNGGDTIEIVGNLLYDSYTDGIYNDTMTDITIKGTGIIRRTSDGCKLPVILGQESNSGSITVEGLTIEDSCPTSSSNSTGSQTTVETRNTDIILKNVTFKNYTAKRGTNNPLIKNTSNLTIIDSTFKDSSFALYGVINSNGGSINISTTTFDNITGLRGASINSSRDKNVIIKNNIFKNVVCIEASDNGEVIGLGFSENATIEGNQFINNIGFNGVLSLGALNTADEYIVKDNVFKGNSNIAFFMINCKNIYISGGSFENNTSFYGPAGLNISESENINITDVNFINNKTTSSLENGDDMNSWGGAIGIDTSSVNIDSCLFDSNESMEGGAIIVFYNGVDLTINNSNFINNKALTGGAIYSEIFPNGDELDNNITINNSDFKGNSANQGGAIYVTDILYEEGDKREDTSKNIVTINSGTFEDNAAREGADIYINEGIETEDIARNEINRVIINGGTFTSDTEENGICNNGYLEIGQNASIDDAIYLKKGQKIYISSTPTSAINIFLEDPESMINDVIIEVASSVIIDMDLINILNDGYFANSASDGIKVSEGYDIIYKYGSVVYKSIYPDHYSTKFGNVISAVPEIEGYVFEGWYTTPTYETKVTNILKGTKGIITLYAKFIDEDEAPKRIYEIGDTFRLGSEEFYVIGHSGPNVLGLAKYNLEVGYTCDKNANCTLIDNASGLQSEDANGVTQFASEEKHGDTLAMYEGSIIEEYVNNYVSYLNEKNMGLNATGRLFTYQDVFNLINGGVSTGVTIKSLVAEKGYDWIIDRNYWAINTRNHYPIDLQLRIGTAGRLGSYNVASTSTGVRPVIEVDESIIENYNNYLSDLSVYDATLNPEFDPNVGEYTVKVGTDVTEVNVSAIPENEDAIVTGTGVHPLPSSETTIEVTVTGTTGLVRIYTITVIKTDEEELEIGDEFKIGDESFYFIGYDGNKMLGLAKYNLFVGNRVYLPENDGWTVEPIANPTGIQNELATGALDRDDTEYFGTVAYSESGENVYENSIVKGYVDDYVIYLSSLDDSLNITGRLINSEELVKLGCSIEEYTCSSAPSWVYDRTYWIDGPGEYPWGVSNSKDFSYDDLPNDAWEGVRPLIEVEKNSIDEDTIIKSSKYIIEDTEYGKIITGSKGDMTISSYLENLDNDLANLIVYDIEGNKLNYTNDDLITTGMVIKLERNDTILDSVTVVIKGDINRDGTINVMDSVILQDHILRKSELDDYRLLACELELDGLVNIGDNVKLMDYILRKTTSLID